MSVPARLLAFLRGQRDVLVCVLLVTIVACVALQRLALLSPSSEQDVLVVDTARTAYVAKQLVEGEGYTTDDLPASLVGFYDREGRLHEERWLNADRFPFGAYATAALYVVTGRRDAWTGVILYNLVTFVALFAALYVFARRVTGSRAGGAIAVVLGLLHGWTYVFLYMKDADMLLLAVLAMSGFHRWLARPLEERRPAPMIWFGTVLAWSFLARPNVGAPFLVALLVLSLAGLYRAIRRLGAARALAAWARADLIAGGVAALWLVPFLVHTLAAWGSPFFSANGLYQPILGTRYGMGTDTWWRYLPPGFDHSVGHLWREARAEVIAKFTTSWMATFRTFVSAHFVDLALAFAAARLPARVPAPGETAPSDRALRTTVWIVFAVFLFNFALLPLYSYKTYSWRHYLGFVLPLLWLGGAIALLHLARWAAPVGRTIRERVGRHPQWLAAALVVLLVLSFLRSPGSDGTYLAMGLTKFWSRRWVIAGLVLLAILAWPRLRRWSGTTWALVLVTLAVIVLYRPHKAHKNFTHIHVPASNRVWTELRARDGLVVSFALQTQVSWNTGRKNIPAPEWVMNVYELERAHRLVVEDLYLESPEAMLRPYDGLFGRAAPGFEGYGRLARYRDHLPGYRLAFHEETKVGRSQFRIAPRAKSSTVYTRTDAAAIAALFRTPLAIALGDPSAVVHTAHGFGGYHRKDGVPVVAATDGTRTRYTPQTDKPWEDTSVTFFVDERVPARATLRFWSPAANTFTFYWNLDLVEYTPARARAAHQLAEVEVGPGWQTVTLDVPPGLVRRGLNKLGFRAAAFTPAALCPTGTPEAICAATGYRAPQPAPAALVYTDTTEPAAVVNLSMLIERLDLATAP